jgi:hypothetical protein
VLVLFCGFRSLFDSDPSFLRLELDFKVVNDLYNDRLVYVKINVLKELAFVNFRMFFRVFFTDFFLFRMLEKLRKFKEEKKKLKELSKKQSKPAFKVSIK